MEDEARELEMLQEKTVSPVTNIAFPSMLKNIRHDESSDSDRLVQMIDKGHPN